MLPRQIANGEGRVDHEERGPDAELARQVPILLIVSAVLAVPTVVVAWLHLDGTGDACTRALVTAARSRTMYRGRRASS
jgi:hypothetical protein